MLGSCNLRQLRMVHAGLLHSALRAVFTLYIHRTAAPHVLQTQLVEAIEDTGFEASVLRQGASSDAVQLRVDGMTCGACSAAVEKALRAAPGVLSAAVNLIAGTAEVRS